jgi:hypothetical protein
MTKALRQGAILFIIVQLAGLASMLIWPFGRVTGPFLWGTAFIALFPGNIAAGLLVEKYLWNTGLSLRVLSIIEIPLLLLFNGVLWFAAIKSVEWLVARLPSCRFPGP